MIIVILALQFLMMSVLAEGLRKLFNTETKESKKNWKVPTENRARPYRPGSFK